MAALESERARRQLQVGVKVISFDEIWTYVGVRRGTARDSLRIWTAVVEDALGNRRQDFNEAGRRKRQSRHAIRLGAHFALRASLFPLYRARKC